MRHVLIAAALAVAACSGPAPAQVFVQDALAGKVDAAALGLETFDAYRVGDSDRINARYQTDGGATVILSYASDDGLTLIESWEDGQSAYTDRDLDCKVDEAALSNTESFNPKLVAFDDLASKSEQEEAQRRFVAILSRFGATCPT